MALHKPKNLNELETAKLFLDHTFENKDYTVNFYSYSGLFYSAEKENLPHNPELTEDFLTGDNIFGIADSFLESIKGKNAVEIFNEELYSNMTLAKRVYDAPEGMYVTDPCYLGKESSKDSVNEIPAGPWEITVKGCMTPTRRMGSLYMEHAPQTDGVRNYVDGFEVNNWSPRATTMWILRPGASFEPAKVSEPAFYVSVDSGCAGAFPIELNQSKDMWRDHYLEVAIGEATEDNAYVLESGIFTGTAYGDGGYSGYELFNSDNESVGYVVCFAGDEFISEESSEQDEYDQEYIAEDLAKKLLVIKDLEAKFSHRGLKINVESAEGMMLNGELDGMLFNLRRVERESQLNVGTVDLEYRKSVEKHYSDRETTYRGKPYTPEWDDAIIDRRLMSKKSALSYPLTEFNILEQMIETLEEVPFESQLFGG